MCGNTELQTYTFCRSQWPRGLKDVGVCGRSLAEIVGSNTGEVMDVFCECWVLSLTECGVSRECGREAPQKKKKNYSILIIKK